MTDTRDDTLNPTQIADDERVVEAGLRPRILSDYVGQEAIKERLTLFIEAAKARGKLASAGPLPHGFMYMLLTYLRGFEGYLCDIATDDPSTAELTSIVERYNVALTRKYLDLGAEYLFYGEDLGMQTALPMSPAMWRERVKPSYEAITSSPGPSPGTTHELSILTASEHARTISSSLDSVSWWKSTRVFTPARRASSIPMTAVEWP